MSRFVVLVLFLVLVSCSKEVDRQIESPILSSPYFPLDIGHQVTYEVTEIIYRNNGQYKDTLNYELKEEIVDSFMDDTDDLLYIVDRSRRSHSGNKWTYSNSWQAQIVNNQAIRIEENRKYIKLRLPIEPEDTWDGNGLFDASDPLTIGDDQIDYFKEWESSIISDNENISIGENSFNQVLHISLANHENRLELRSAQEMYAPTIGLIYREFKILDTQCFENCESLTWEEKAERGHIYIQRIIN